MYNHNVHCIHISQDGSIYIAISSVYSQEGGVCMLISSVYSQEGSACAVVSLMYSQEGSMHCSSTIYNTYTLFSFVVIKKHNILRRLPVTRISTLYNYYLKKRLSYLRISFRVFEPQVINVMSQRICTSFDTLNTTIKQATTSVYRRNAVY